MSDAAAVKSAGDFLEGLTKLTRETGVFVGVYMSDCGMTLIADGTEHPIFGSSSNVKWDGNEYALETY